MPSNQLALPLWIWSDEMGFFTPALNDHLIAAQLKMMQADRARRRAAVPAGNVFDLISPELYPAGHPYHVESFLGTARLQGLLAAELRAFVESHYTPARATLSLTGDFETEHARALVEKYFGSLPPRPGWVVAGPSPAPGARREQPAVPGSRSAAPPSLVGETRLKVAARVDFPSVTIAWPTPRSYEPGDAELDLIAELLVGRRVGWLRWKLIDELKIASTVWARQYSHQLGSEFMIQATATRGHTAAELVDAIDQVLRRLQTIAPDDDAFRGAFTGFLFDKVLATEHDIVSASAYGRAPRPHAGSPRRRLHPQRPPLPFPMTTPSVLTLPNRSRPAPTLRWCPV